MNPARGFGSRTPRKFPEGFRGLAAKLWQRISAHLGIWISPLGGYGGAEERTAQARKLGLIPETGQLDLSYPGYKTWFQDSLPPTHAGGRRERI